MYGTITIDEEFRALLPVLDTETYAMLEESLLRNGCLHPLVLWGNTLLDGHNRYEISMRHGIPFSVVSKEFASRDEALIWIITAQVSRRNITPIQLSHLRGLHYNAAKRIQGTNNQYAQKSEKSQDATFHGSTAKWLAAHYNVSRDTIIRDSKVAGAIEAIGKTSPEAKRMVLSGETGIPRNLLQGLSAEPGDKVIELAARIEGGTYEKKGNAGPGQGAGAAPEDEGPAGAGAMHSAIGRVTDDFREDLRRLAKGSDEDELRTRLRAFIDALEELHKHWGRQATIDAA